MKGRRPLRGRRGALAALALGITVPGAVLLRADEVIR
jgi:hypothetical protein